VIANTGRGAIFVTRGRGRGHAVPDMAIVRELERIQPGLDIHFVSYSGGARALRSSGYDVIDLQMPDEPSLWVAVIAQTRIIGGLEPELIIAHEEPPALIAAKTFLVPCIFITDFFQDPNSLFTRAIEYASSIIFTAEPGIYTEPPFLAPPVHYVGPAVRRFEYGRTGRERARRELGVPAGATVVLCQPGNWPEAQAPVAQLLMEAWDSLPYPSKRLIWLAGRDYKMLRARFHGRTGVTVIEEDWEIGRLFAASDLLITKANRLTVYEAASLGLPSISISSGLNWPDDAAVARVRSNTALHVRGLTPGVLGRLMTERIGAGWVAEEDLPKWDGVRRAAEIIAASVEQMRGAAECPKPGQCLPSVNE
jgi:hypothetical protein